MKSYDPARTTAGGFGAEVERLERQAALSWDDERRALSGLGLEDARVVVDVGCGPGAVTRRLLDWLRATVVAVDVAPELLSLAPPEAARAVGDASQLPLADGRVDAILLRYVLQHLADPVLALQEAARVLRPGGRIVVVDVDAQLWGAATPTLPGLAAVYRKVGMLQRDRGGDRTVARRVPGLLAAVGFEDVRVLPFATTSDRHPVQDFALHAGPERLLPLVESGELSLQDYGVALRGWTTFCALPQAWVMALGFAITGTRPDRPGRAMGDGVAG